MARETTTIFPVSHETHEAIRHGMIARARATLAKYPQYASYFGPDWRLVRMSKAVKTKAGKYFERGDYALVTDRSDHVSISDGKPMVIAFGERLPFFVVIPITSVREVS